MMVDLLIVDEILSAGFTYAIEGQVYPSEGR